MNELDKDIKKLILKKHQYYIDNDNGKISNKEFEKNIKDIDVKLRQLNEIKIQEMNQEIEDREKVIKIEQDKLDVKLEEIKNEANSKIVNNKYIYDDKALYDIIKNKAQLKKESYTKLIIYALRIPVIDTEEKVIAMVLNWKPGTHRENIKKQIKNIISAIKKQKQKRFKSYSWNYDKYLVIKKWQTTL